MFLADNPYVPNNHFTPSGFVLIYPFSIIISSLRDLFTFIFFYNHFIPSGLKKMPKA
jgi:hypothetical protein